MPYCSIPCLETTISSLFWVWLLYVNDQQPTQFFLKEWSKGKVKDISFCARKNFACMISVYLYNNIMNLVQLSLRYMKLLLHGSEVV